MTDRRSVQQATLGPAQPDLTVTWFAGVDVGGTFTDIVLADREGRAHVRKVLTTHDDPRVAVVEGLRLVLDDAGAAPGNVDRVVHGTTLATNVILERKGGPVAFVTTAGFGDLLRLGREARVEEDRYDLFFNVPQPPVAHEFTFEVDERVDARGEVLTTLTPEVAEAVANRVAAAAPVAVAVCFLHAYANSAHETLMAEACRRALPDTFVVTSSEVWPEIREYDRAMTTVMCAYVGPVMARYLDGLGSDLARLGVRCPIDVMESSGAVMSAARAARRPVYTVESGGAAGVIAAAVVGQLIAATDVISFDMGGTTAKTGVVRDGRPGVTAGFQVGGTSSFGGSRAGVGFPVKIPVVDLAEVGAGGGSIAWVDSGGALRVGPRSAGSVPGPACYGRGGMEPTVTDANLVLGYLDPAGMAGGMTLSRERAEAAIEEAVARPLRLDVAQAARAIHEIVTANMAGAIRVVTVQRGIDPRAFTLVGFGGAGPMHVARLAATFGIGDVAVPWAAGVASAIGLLHADRSVDRVRTRISESHGRELDAINQLFADLEQECRHELGETGGTEHPSDSGTIIVTRSVDARFRGQAHQLTVPAGGPERLSLENLAGLAKRFREHYHQTYGIDLDAPVEFVALRVRVTAPVDKPALQPQPGEADADPVVAGAGERDAYFPESDAFEPTPVFAWARLPPGAAVVGPALIEGPDSTVVVPPGYRAEIDGWRNVLLESA